VLFNAGPQSLDAGENYWGTTNVQHIRKLIYDFEDQSTLQLVQFEPFRTTPTTSNVFTGSCAYLPVMRR
jgi:hypothetical protein